MFVSTQVYEEERSLHTNSNGHVKKMRASLQRTFYGSRVVLRRFSQNWQKATIGFVMSVCPFLHPSAWNNSAPTGRIFMKF